jgi:hypothetical protein
MNRSRIRRITLGAVAALTATAALTTPANAASLVTTATDCGTPDLSQSFGAFGDDDMYKLLDGGSFEGGAAGWQLRGGARVVGGNEPFHVRGADDAFSLSLPPGSSAVSAPVCVGRFEPTMRFFAGRTRGSALSTLTVAVQVELFTGTWVTLPIGIDTGAGWNASPKLLVLANLLPPVNEQTKVRFVFAPLLGGEWNVDDVYVDPRARI